MPSRSRATEHAIIDIGSNSVRLVIFGGPARAPAPLFNEKVVARLGRGVIENGALSKKSMQTALAALQRFASLMRLRNVSSIETVATAAVRDATNGRDFLDCIGQLGLKPRLLSGKEEAELSAMGVAGAFPGADGIVADLGGGSIELVNLADDRCDHGVSLPLGSLRLPQLRQKGAAGFHRQVRKTLSSAQLPGKSCNTLYLVGGSFRALARYAMQQMAWPLDDPHGFEIASARAMPVLRKLARTRSELAVKGVSSSRLASLPDSAALLMELVGELNPDRLVFSAWGLREGLLCSRMDSPTRGQDPLLALASSFSESMGASPLSAAMVAGWTSAAIPADSSHSENLRLASTMLALALQRTEPNLRADQAVAWALRKRWIGATVESRTIMAACLVASLGGDRRLVPGIEQLAPSERIAEAEIWGLAIRLCRRLSAFSPLALSNSELRVEQETLVLELEDISRALYNEAVEKDLRNLAARMGLNDIRVS